MTKKVAFDQAKKIFPNCKPTRASGFSTTTDGKGVIIPCYDTDSALVIYDPNDISRLMGMLQLAKMNLEKK